MKILKNNFLVKFIITLFLIGFIFGFLYFITIKPEVTSLIEGFKETINSSRQNTYLLSLGIICIIFFLSVSVLGLPIIFFINFYAGLSLGYTLCAFISFANLKGFFFYLIFIFLSKLIFLVVLMYFIYTSVQFTYSLVMKFIKKDQSGFYYLIIGHFYRFLIVLGAVLVNSSLIYLFTNKILSFMLDWL